MMPLAKTAWSPSLVEITSSCGALCWPSSSVSAAAFSMSTWALCWPSSSAHGADPEPEVIEEDVVGEDGDALPTVFADVCAPAPARVADPEHEVNGENVVGEGDGALPTMAPTAGDAPASALVAGSFVTLSRPGGYLGKVRSGPAGCCVESDATSLKSSFRCGAGREGDRSNSGSLNAQPSSHR